MKLELGSWLERRWSHRLWWLVSVVVQSVEEVVGVLDGHRLARDKIGQLSDWKRALLTTTRRRRGGNESRESKENCGEVHSGESICL